MATQNVDLLIVGGGLAGLSLACSLQAQGVRDVVVLEAAELASGVTAGSLGGVRRQFSHSLEIELALRGIEFWETVERRFDHPCRWHQDGYLLVTGDEERMEKLVDASAQQCALGGGPSIPLVGRDLAHAAPWINLDGLVGGVWTPKDGRVNATDGVSALAQGFRSNGGTIRTFSRVRTVSRTSSTWHVIADREYHAKTIVVAGGLGTNALLSPLGFELGIYRWPCRYAFTEPALAGETVPLTLDLDSGFAMGREGDGLAVSVLDPEYENDTTPMRWLEAVADTVAKRVPQLGSIGIRSTMVADADGCVDGRPYAGVLDDHLWVFAGFSGHGVVHAPAIADQLARLMTGARPDIDISPFDPLRSAEAEPEWMTAVKQPTR